MNTRIFLANQFLKENGYEFSSAEYSDFEIKTMLAGFVKYLEDKNKIQEITPELKEQLKTIKLGRADTWDKTKTHKDFA